MKTIKGISLLFVSLFFSLVSYAQMSGDAAARLKLIEDRIAIKTLVDTFSVLADQKETDKQTLLFTEDAVIESVVNGQAGMALRGRKQIGDAFGAFLKNFEVVYHINGQQTLTLNGDKASGISYCAVTLIGQDNGKRMKTSMNVFYQDEYVRQNGRWLIAKRRSNFVSQERLPVGQ